jgi:O-antigen/teichoic acid export membrane protein
MHRPVALIVFSTASAFVARLSSLICQVIVGCYLSDVEIGAFALAVGITGLTGILRGGGDTQELLALKPESFDQQSGRLFWWGASFWWFGFFLTASVAVGVDRLSVYWPDLTTPGLVVLLWALGFRQLMTPIAQIARLRLVMEFRFRDLSALDTSISIVKILLTFIAAQQGWGAFALAGPWLLQTLVEASICVPAARLSRVNFIWNGLSLRQMWQAMKWPFMIGIISSVNQQCGFLLAGLVAPLAIVGLFYFAYQLANAPRLLVVQSIQTVLGPLLAKARGDAVEERRVLIASLRGAFLFFPMMTGFTVAVFPEVDSLFWNGRWAGTSRAVEFLSVGVTFMGIAGILIGALTGLRSFKGIALYEAVRAAGIVVGIGLGGGLIVLSEWFNVVQLSSIDLLSLGTGAGMTLSAGWVSWRIAQRLGLSSSEILAIMSFGPATAFLITLGAQSVAASVEASVFATPSTVSRITSLSIASTLYSLMSILAARFTAESTVRGVVEMIPAPFRSVAIRVFGLR